MVPEWCEHEFGGLLFAQAGFVVVAARATHSGNFRAGNAAGLGASPENLRRVDRVVEFLDSLDFVDGRRIVMSGHSMGGFLTAGYMAKGKYRDRIRAAAPVSAAVSNEEDLRQRDGRASAATGATPDVLRRLHALSPEDARLIERPLFLAHGTEDPAVPASSSEALKRILEGGGISVELVLFPGEGHHIYRTRKKEVFEPMIRFFRRQLDRTPSSQISAGETADDEKPHGNTAIP
jgi:dipeptidyl aminopeptidase/acylaminoacyl peptidase